MSITRALGFALLFGALASTSANAEVSRLTLKFAGGCKANVKGTCFVKVQATGSHFTSDDDTIVIQSAPTEKGHYKNITTHLRPLSSSGFVEIQFANAKACYRAMTGPNGNSKPDRTSNVLCE